MHCKKFKILDIFILQYNLMRKGKELAELTLPSLQDKDYVGNYSE